MTDAWTTAGGTIASAATATSSNATPPLLSVESLSTLIHTPDGRALRILRDVDLTIEAGECLGVVGESGSGKSFLARTVLGVHGRTDRVETTGRVRLDGEDLLSAPPRRRAAVLGTGIAMVHQDPMTSLNPVVRVGEQIVEAVTNRQRLPRGQRRALAARLLRSVDVPDPERRARAWPHELSGGLRQRAGIAAALAGEPRLLLADEPTTALDVTVQRTVLDLLDRHRVERGLGVLLITHDIGLLSGRARRIAVMYAGRIVETGRTEDVTAAPVHPYTAALLRSVPRVTGPLIRTLPTIAGSPPDPASNAPGCPFASRCDRAEALCSAEAPPLVRVSDSHTAACHRPLIPAEESCS
ncbi:ABC transporter ATP-binding protein [Catenulispora sp. NF23]|uniref:ABC transporter ATP-binding protein n=1 Tax=Catenulispora pinistramenti TaxID=2705254 RepID=UPI001BA99CDF|nr:ABC transporter ATP-binding protein [Catenulispora pinistramenti]MBS2535604.1 ABC transporter ATP-binding protein [Catenulispora pinistramenti]